MGYHIFNWSGEEPYRDRNQRQGKPKPCRTIYPWDKMRPGQFFHIAVSMPRDDKEIHSKINTIRNSAKNFGIYVKCYIGNYEALQGKLGIRIIHDGVIK